MISILKRQWPLICILFISLFYIGTIPLAASKDGDIIHMWVGGRTISSGLGGDLYNPNIQYEILDQSHVEADEFWGERYDILGAFFYPPPTALLYASVGWLDLTSAQAAVAILNIAAGFGAAIALFYLLQKRLSFGLIFLTLFTFPSFFYSFTLGQNGILTLAIVMSSWLLISTNQGGWGGVVFATLIYKPNWLAALGWVPLTEKRWKVLAGIVIGTVGIVSLTAIILGIQPFIDYGANLLNLVNLHDLPDYPIETQYSILAFFRRWLGNGLTADLLGWSTVSLIVISTFWLIGFKMEQSKPGTDRFLLTAALGWVTAALFNPHLHHYDLMLVVAAALVSLIEWPTVSRNQRFALLIIFLFNQSAFIISSISSLLSSWKFEFSLLPTLAALLIWGWLFGRIFSGNSIKKQE